MAKPSSAAAAFFFFFFTAALFLLSASPSRASASTHHAALLWLPDSTLAAASRSLQSAAGGDGSFVAAAMLLPHLRPFTRQRTTLLVPTDDALLRSGAVAAAAGVAQLRALARLHMLTASLDAGALQALPNGTLLPTLLGKRHRLSVTNAAGHLLFIGGARVVHPDLCPRSLSPILSCHGIDRLLFLSPTSSSSSSSSAPPPNTSASPASHSYGHGVSSPDSAVSRNRLPNSTSASTSAFATASLSHTSSPAAAHQPISLLLFLVASSLIFAAAV